MQELSIVIPVWDRYASLLPRAVESFTEADLEVARVIVVDNCSSEEIRCDQATVIRLPRRVTVGAARNAALASIDTEWVQFWDADDVAVPGATKALMERTGGDVVAVTGTSLGWDEQSGHTFTWPWPRAWTPELAKRRRLLMLASLVLCPFPTTGPAVLRTEAVREAGGFAEELELAEDWALAVGLACRGTVVATDAPGRYYRIGRETLTAQAGDEAARAGNAFSSIRRRVKDDPGVPRWLRWCLPAAQLAHLLKALAWRRTAAVGTGFYRSALEQAELHRRDREPDDGHGAVGTRG